MDIAWTEAEIAFRDEVRAFLAAKLTPELRRAGALATSVYPDHHASMAWQAILHERGWAAPHWPVAHGGCDWTLAQHYIFNSERIAAGAPSLSPMGIHMVAHVIIRFGTPEQKAWFLPRILTGEVFFCQGYSEPGAGSDLASLQMSAVPDGSDFILNGSKIWTTHATEANWIFCLVRTGREGRPQQGITFLLAPMDSPGITIQPILMTSGEHVQNQIFFDDVRVAQSNVLGEIGQGWGVAKYLLEFERGGSYAPALQVRAAEIEAAAATMRTATGTLLDDPLFAARLAELRIRIDVLEMTEMRLLSASEGSSVGAFASMLKILGTELAQDLAALLLDVAGPQGAAFQPHGAMPGGPIPHHAAPADGHVSGAPWQALAPLRYLNERAGSIYAGSNEIQRNILAKAVLNL
jgi:alkylation response protein AidB-like acyl-CoA dehydrogenase